MKLRSWPWLGMVWYLAQHPAARCSAHAAPLAALLWTAVKQQSPVQLEAQQHLSGCMLRLRCLPTALISDTMRLAPGPFSCPSVSSAMLWRAWNQMS